MTISLVPQAFLSTQIGKSPSSWATIAARLSTCAHQDLQVSRGAPTSYNRILGRWGRPSTAQHWCPAASCSCFFWVGRGGARGLDQCEDDDEPGQPLLGHVRPPPRQHLIPSGFEDGDGCSLALGLPLHLRGTKAVGCSAAGCKERHRPPPAAGKHRWWRWTTECVVYVTRCVLTVQYI